MIVKLTCAVKGYFGRDIIFIDLMGISPAPNNGTPGALHDIMHNPPTLQTTPMVSYRDCPVSSVNTATPKISCSCNMVITSDIELIHKRSVKLPLDKLVK